MITPDGNIISEVALTAALGGILRDGYEQMYSLDDDSLEKGGESILDSRGDLGALLFSAMSGLPEISTTLTSIQNKADEFFKTSGRSYRLNTLKQELDEIKAKLRENDVETSAYVKLREQATQTKREWEQIKSQRDEQKSRLRMLQSFLSAYVPINVVVHLEAAIKMNHRQLWFIGELQRGKKWKAEDIAKQWWVTEKTAKRDIARLVQLKMVRFAGARKNGWYTLLC